MLGLSRARLFANSDIPTGPTLAACGDAIARNVASTAPLRAADASRIEFDVDASVILIFSGGGCHSHGCCSICTAVGRFCGTMCNICRNRSLTSDDTRPHRCKKYETKKLSKHYTQGANTHRQFTSESKSM